MNCNVGAQGADSESALDHASIFSSSMKDNDILWKKLNVFARIYQ